MRNALPAVAVALFCISLAHAQTDVLIEIDRGRTEGVFTKSPVFQRAILAKPAKPTDTVFPICCHSVPSADAYAVRFPLARTSRTHIG